MNALLALLGAAVAIVIGLLVVFTVALCAGDSEEMGRVLPGRWRL